MPVHTGSFAIGNSADKPLPPTKGTLEGSVIASAVALVMKPVKRP